jgi:hypothetical protein
MISPGSATSAMWNVVGGVVALETEGNPDGDAAVNDVSLLVVPPEEMTVTG